MIVEQAAYGDRRVESLGLTELRGGPVGGLRPKSLLGWGGDVLRYLVRAAGSVALGPATLSLLRSA